MKNLIVLILAAFIMVGCIGGIGGQQQTKGQADGIAPQIPQIPGKGTESGEAQLCSPSYSFSEPQTGVLSKTSSITATVTCAAGKKIAVKLDGVEVASKSAATNGTEPLKIEFAPARDGTIKLTVESDGEVVYSKDWKVNPLGNNNTSGLDYDSVSFKEWRAMAVDVENTIRPSRVRIYMKRIAYKTQPNTEIVVEIRDDNAGKPGRVVSSVKKLINVTTLSDNWINFDFDQKPTLSPGRYWITVRIEQTENVNLISDVVNIHYVVVDKQSPGNDYTRQMMLDVNPATGFASETEWTPLSYDRAYAIVLTTEK